MTSAGTVVDGSRQVSFEGIDGWDQVDRAIGTAPSVVYYWVREAFVRIQIDHRSRFLRRSKIRLNKKPSKANKRPIQAPKVDEAGSGFDLERGIRWKVLPRDKRRPDARAADLAELQFETLSRSSVLRAWETGGRINPKRGRKLAVPITPPGAKGRGKRSPGQFRAANPKAVLIAKPSKKSGTLLLFERKRKRSGTRTRIQTTRSGRARRTQRKTLVDTLIPRWALLDSVDLRRILGFYASWNELDAKRRERFTFAAKRIIRDLGRNIRN